MRALMVVVLVSAFPGAPLGLYNGFPWFLPLAGAWHKFLDWVE